MFDYGLLNLASLILGIASWTIPIFNFVRVKKINTNNFFVSSFFSMVFCMASIFCQIIYTNHLVTISDWSALLDTNDFVVFVCLVLILGTIFLNFLSSNNFLKQSGKNKI